MDTIIDKSIGIWETKNKNATKLEGSIVKRAIIGLSVTDAQKVYLCSEMVGDSFQCSFGSTAGLLEASLMQQSYDFFAHTSQ